VRHHPVLETLRDEYEALFGKGTGPLILARTDSLVTDGFGKHQCYSVHNLFARANLTSSFGIQQSMLSNVASNFEKLDVI
jgi:hypothetical protein